jgi:hypothetical protein
MEPSGVYLLEGPCLACGDLDLSRYGGGCNASLQVNIFEVHIDRIGIASRGIAAVGSYDC